MELNFKIKNLIPYAVKFYCISPCYWMHHNNVTFCQSDPQY